MKIFSISIKHKFEIFNLIIEINIIYLYIYIFFRFSSCEVPKAGLLNQKGIILTEKLSNNYEEEKIIEDAIEVGAEDAELIQENNEEFLQVLK
jgi:hypothetical protein